MADAPTPLKPGMPAISTGGRVGAIVPQSFNEIVQIAGAVVQAGMAPKGLDTTAKVTIAIMHGMELGMTPMAALQSIAVINGRPSIFGDGLVALVRASGHLEDLKEGIDVDDKGTPMLAWCEVKRRGEATWKRRELNYVECVRAGWTQKDGPWKLTPGRMMSVRCRGWLLRDVFADVLRGIQSAEEAQDMLDVGTATVVPPEPKRSDYDPKTGEVVATPTAEKKSEPSTGAKPAEKKRQPRNKSKAKPEMGAGNDGQAGASAAPVAGDAAATASGQPAVTDVVDENAPIEFPEFTRMTEFLDFSAGWMADPARTPAHAKQWEETFRDKIATAGKSDIKRIANGIADVLVVYGQVLAREPAREPGVEG
jgi:hypothetical protein